MATWSFAAVDSMASALALFATNGASLLFYDSVGSVVGPALIGSAQFHSGIVSGVLTVRNFTAATATGAFTLGTAKLFASAGGATIGSFICTTAGAVDFVFAGGLSVGNTDTITINSWTITVSASSA